MKKIWNLIIVLMLIVSISTLAIADDADEDDEDLDLGDLEENNNETEPPDDNETEETNNNESQSPEGNETTEENGNETEVDEETESEIKIMNNSLGAEIRLLQLEKAILRNLLKGERAVAVLQDLGYNTTDLESILELLRLVLEEVQSADASANNSVQEFIDLKSDARNLTKQFREKIRELLGDLKLNEIKQRIRDTVSDEINNYTRRIRNKVKQFNRNQIHRLYGLLGVHNETLAEKYQNGTVSIEEVKSQISKKVNNQIKQKRKQIFLELKKGNINQENYANQEAENATLTFEERQQLRNQNRRNNTPGNPGNSNNASENGKGRGKQK